MLREIDSPWLRGNWDPANCVDLNEVPYPDGYNHVRGLFRHMHLKDLFLIPRPARPTMCPSARASWISTAVPGSYQRWVPGTMSVETHYRRPDGNRKEATASAWTA